jgi:nucleoside-diphosphate-sugar epimerase
VNPNLDFPGFKHLPAPEADVKFRIGASDKARNALGWTPKYELDYIIEDTLTFIKQRIGAPK